MLVTGASGFVGRALVERLVAEGVPTVAAVRTAPTLHGGTRQVTAPDLGPNADWRAALDGAECVVHLAARVHVMRDDAADPLSEFRRVNVDGTLALARQAATAASHSAPSGAYGRPSRYAKVVASGLTYCISHPDEAADSGYDISRVEKLFTKLS